MTVKIANNIGFNLYGKYRVVIGRNNGPSLAARGAGDPSPREDYTGSMLEDRRIVDDTARQHLPGAG